MRIDSVRKFCNFGSQPVYPINFKMMRRDGNFSLLKGNFSKISLYDQGDYVALEKAASLWDDITLGNVCYIKSIVSDFKNPKPYMDYYITETRTPTDDLYSRLTSVVEVTNPQIPDKDFFSIFYVQSAPVNSYFSRILPLKGAGELAIYGAVKLAKENGFKKVSLFSSNNAFYDKIGMPRIKKYNEQIFTTPYLLKEEDYDKFMGNIERKYSLNA